MDETRMNRGHTSNALGGHGERLIARRLKKAGLFAQGARVERHGLGAPSGGLAGFERSLGLSPLLTDLWKTRPDLWKTNERS